MDGERLIEILCERIRRKCRRVTDEEIVRELKRVNEQDLWSIVENGK